MSKTKQKMKKVGRVILLAIISLTIGATVYGWNARTLVGNAMPMPFGIGVSVVLSGSMEPELFVNDVVIVREATDYKVDDVVVYQDGNMLVAHKIISMNGGTIITKGVANNTADDPITASAIKGKAIARIPFAGVAVRFFKTPVGTVLLAVLAIILFELPYLQKRKEADEYREKIKKEIRKLKGKDSHA